MNNRKFFAPVPFVGKIPKTDTSQLAQQQDPPGTAYAGQYVKIEGENYIRGRQTRFQSHEDIATGSYQVTTQKTYLTFFFLSLAGVTGTGSLGNTWRMRDGGSSGIIVMEGKFTDGDSQVIMSFPLAVEFATDLYFEFNAGTAGDGDINLYGWTEE